MFGVRFLGTAAVAAGALGGLSSAAYGLLTRQSRHARLIIGVPENPPLNADGVYLPDGTGPLPVTASPDALRFAVVGDSSAAGLGVDEAGQLPGVLLARGLAEESDRPVRLITYAISGATTRDIAPQVDLAVAGPPDVTLVIIGGNDVTDRLPVRASAALLGIHVRRLLGSGSTVVVGTCPDLGAILPIPQPLRSIARAWSLLLARAQRTSVVRAGGNPVPLADLLSPEFLARPTELFSADQFHPNAAGYEAAASVLLAPLCEAAGVWTGGPLPELPTRSATAEAHKPTARLAAAVSKRVNKGREAVTERLTDTPSPAQPVVT